MLVMQFENRSPAKALERGNKRFSLRLCAFAGKNLLCAFTRERFRALISNRTETGAGNEPGILRQYAAWITCRRRIPSFRSSA